MMARKKQDPLITVIEQALRCDEFIEWYDVSEFIDDLEVNIEAAQRAGIRGHQFTSQVILEQELGNLGVI